MTWRLRLFLLWTLAAGWVPAALAQQSPATAPPPLERNPSSGSNILTFFSGRTPYEFWLTCLIGVIGLTVITLLTLTLRRLPNATAEDVTRPAVVITVITGTLILVTAGYSNEQIAPAFGLFGTIVGYILGRLSPNGKGGSTGT